MTYDEMSNFTHEELSQFTYGELSLEKTRLLYQILNDDNIVIPRSKLATTTSSGGLLLALKRAVCVRA